jgi:PKD repeat protein
MKKLAILSFLIFCASLQIRAQVCLGGIRYSYTANIQTIWFGDSSSTSIINPIKAYVYWDFGDGTSDTANGLVHSFPAQAMYWVKKEVKYYETGNPSNFCTRLDSVQVDASLFVAGCSPHSDSRVQWLTGLTYGISSYYSGCPTSVNEVVVNAGSSVSAGPGPMSGIFTSHSNFFTYNLPYNGVFSITHHVTQAAPYSSSQMITHVISPPVTPAACHASFYLAQDPTDINSWYLYNYSSGGGMLNYLWDFGDGTTSTMISPTHTYAIIDNYNVCLTVSDSSCSDTYCDTAFFDPADPSNGILNIRAVNMAIGINELEAAKTFFDLSPNPADNELNVEILAAGEGTVIRIFDNLGRELVLPMETSGKNTKLSLSGINAGIYMVTVSNGKQITAKKFIKN